MSRSQPIKPLQVSMPPKQCYSNRAYLRHMVYFSFPPVVTLSDGDLSNELLLCTHSVVSFIGDDRCINYFSKFIFCDLEWGDILV